MKKVEFIGTPTGDGECFCWIVDKNTWKSIMGREPDEFDYFLGKLFLYPDDVFTDGIAITTVNGDRKCKIKIEFETLE